MNLLFEFEVPLDLANHLIGLGQKKLFKIFQIPEHLRIDSLVFEQITVLIAECVASLHGN